MNGYEDCLTLNIWKPAGHEAQSLPVMVYIHGGNFRVGSSSLPEWTGSKLAKQGVIVVTINYRLGFLGRFAHPALSREQAGEPLANYGTMDQIAALRWVGNNISAFGGDPGNVTIFGHSAGGVSVNFLMITPLSKGLFHKAVAQGSGVFLDRSRHISQRGIPGPGGPSLEDIGSDLADHFGISGTDSEVVRTLKALPVDQIVEYQRKRLAITLLPVVDGTIVPDSIARMFEQGKQHDVPYIGGATNWEWNLGFLQSSQNQLLSFVKTQKMANKITKQDIELLKHIADFEILTVKQLATISRRSVQVIRRRLRFLFLEGLVEKQMRGYGRTKGRPEEITFLTEYGAERLRNQGIIDKTHTALSENALRTLPLDHDLLLSWFHLYMLHIERENHQLKVAGFTTNTTFSSQAVLCSTFIPDGVFTIKETFSSKTLLFLLEVDMGSESAASSVRNQNDVRQKVLNYQELFRCEKYKQCEKSFRVHRLSPFDPDKHAAQADKPLPSCAGNAAI